MMLSISIMLKKLAVKKMKQALSEIQIFFRKDENEKIRQDLKAKLFIRVLRFWDSIFINSWKNRSK